MWIPTHWPGRAQQQPEKGIRAVVPDVLTPERKLNMYVVDKDVWIRGQPGFHASIRDEKACDGPWT